MIAVLDPAGDVRRHLGAESDVVRTARLLAAATGAQAVVSASVDAVLEGGSMELRGPLLSVPARGRPQMARGGRSGRVAAAVEHTPFGTRPEPGPVALAEWARLDRLLYDAAAAGIATSGLGRTWSWGRKDALERRLRRYQQRTGRGIPRPRTWVPAPGQGPALVERLRGQGLRLIIKAARTHQSLGVTILGTGPVPESAGRECVVQELLAEPLLLDGHKFDLRGHVLVTPAGRHASFALDATLARIAARPFVPESEEAELTPNLVRIRLGLPPGIFALERAPMPPELAHRLSSAAVRLGEEFLDVYFEWLENDPLADPPDRRAHRAFLLGLDMLVTGTATRPALQLLEVNPHPFLYRHFEPCDVAVERAVSDGLGAGLRTLLEPPAAAGGAQ